MHEQLWLSPSNTNNDEAALRTIDMAHRYVFFSARFDPCIGGVESFTLNLARELVRQGDEVAVVTKRIDNSPEQETRADGISVTRLPTISLVNNRLPLSKRNRRHRELLAQVAAAGVDRVLVNNRFYPHSIDGLEFARATDSPAVMLDHGSAYLTLGSPLIDLAIRRYEHAMTERAKLYQPVFCGVSAKSAKWLGEFGIDTSLVIPNAIDGQSFRNQASSRQFRSELGITNKETLVAFVGRIAPEKGASAFVQAASHLVNEPMKFVLAGEGALRTKLESTAYKNTAFLGLLGRSDMSALLRDADIFCLPSRSEGFCTSLLEASAWATPSVITDVGGVQEVIRNPMCGIIIKDMTADTIAEGLRTMLNLGHNGRRSMGENAQHIIEQHCSWKASAMALESVFNQMDNDAVRLHR